MQVNADIVRFQEKISVSPNGCWIWSASLRPNGYGQFSLNGVIRYAHRAAYELYVGTIPSRLCVCHKCDNKRCVNPEHLFLGTKADNSRDMKNKGRHRTNPTIGERHWKARLSANDVKEIRSLLEHGCTTVALSNRFGVSTTHISRIGRRKNWKHIN